MSSLARDGSILSAFSVVALVVAASPSVVTTAGRGPEGPRAAGTGVVVFADEFNGASLDPTRWNVEITGRTVNDENQAYVDSPETIDVVTGAAAPGADGGALRIRARFREGYATPQGRRFDFVSGRINTSGKVEFTYGTVAARIRLTAGSGLWPAFWALGAGRWPDTGEFDIMENVGDAGWINAAMHGPGYSGATPLTARHSFAGGADITGWHVYAAEWTADRFVFSVDGQPFYTVSRTQVERYGRWAFDTPKFLILNMAVGGRYPQAVNKVDAPYPGVLAPTVDLVKADRAVMLVDWVRVTR